MIGRTWALAAATLALAASGCAKRELSVTRGWVRLAANPGAPAAAYFIVTGGTAADTLIGVSTPMAARAEMHETMAMGAMTGMTPLRRVPVPAGGEVAFEPGGRHVMLFGVKPSVAAPGTDILTFAFASGKRVDGYFNVVGPGDPPTPS